MAILFVILVRFVIPVTVILVVHCIMQFIFAMPKRLTTYVARFTANGLFLKNKGSKIAEVHTHLHQISIGLLLYDGGERGALAEKETQMHNNVV